MNLCIILVSDMSKVQDDEVGDGTTSVTVLAAELLRVRQYSFFNMPAVLTVSKECASEPLVLSSYLHH